MENENELRALFDEFIAGGVDAEEMAKALGYNPSLGQSIGKVVDNFTITNDAGDKVQLKLTFDFSTSTNVDIKSWLCGNRRIALQRPARAMSRNELTSMNNTVIMAVDAGKKVKTRQEKINAYTTMGLPEDVAILAVDNPMKFKETMDSIEVDEETIEE